VIPLLAIGFLEAGLGLSQYLAGAESVEGTYLSKDHFAGLLEMILPFAIMYAVVLLYRGRERGTLSAWSATKSCAALSIAVAVFLAILFSFCRMGFLSTLGSLFVMGAMALGSRLGGWKKSSAIAGLAVLILMVFVFLPPSELVERFGNLDDAQGRWPIWKDTLQLIAAYPLFGCGLGNYYPALLKFQTADVDLAYLQAHNDYLQLIAELGIGGFLVPATLMAIVFLNAVRGAESQSSREVRYLGLACVGGITAILIHSLAEFNMYIPANAMTLAWISGVAVSLPLQSGPPEAQRHTVSPAFVKKFGLVLGAVLVVYAPAWVLFLQFFQGDLKAERLFCHFGICGTEVVETQQTLQDGNASAIPLERFRELLRRDPASPGRWCDLGEALWKSGDIEKARYCYSQALALGPNIPPILSAVADFCFAVGENSTALGDLSRVLSETPSYDPSIFDLYEEKKISCDDVLRSGLPDRRSSQAYLRHLLSGKNTPCAESTWKWILSRRWADDRLAAEYVNFLIQAQQYDSAAQAWAVYMGGRAKGYPEANRVFNGDFESDLTGNRFDWTIEPTAGVAIDFDRDTRHSGDRCLRIQFDGTQNVGNIGLRQTVFLKPGRYRFQAYIRTKEVSTDEGVAFSVVDEETSKRVSFTTESLLGSSDWRLVEREFEAPPGTGLVQVSLIRKPSWKFDNLIRGTVWIDGVSIGPEQKDSRSAGFRRAED
jgi:O-antigen ligase